MASLRLFMCVFLITVINVYGSAEARKCYVCSNCNDVTALEPEICPPRSTPEISEESRENTTEEDTAEVPDTEENITEEDTAEVPDTEENTTEEDTAEVPDTEENITEEDTAEVPDTEENITEEDTAEVPDTEENITEEDTGEIPDTEENTTEEDTTEVPDTEENITEEDTTEVPDTEENITEEDTAVVPDTEENITEENTGVVPGAGVNPAEESGNTNSVCKKDDLSYHGSPHVLLRKLQQSRNYADDDDARCIVTIFQNPVTGQSQTERGCVHVSVDEVFDAEARCRELIGSEDTPFPGSLERCLICSRDGCNTAEKVTGAVLLLAITLVVYQLL